MASQQGVYMDTDAVRGMAKSFGTINEVLETVGKVLESISQALTFAALIGPGAAAKAFIDNYLRPTIKEIAEKCEELNKDLDASVDAYERGDELGSTRFH